MNPTLQQIHGLLLAQHQALSQSLDGVTDVDQAKTIVREMQELLHRIDLVQNLLFTDNSKKLKDTLAGITKASDALSDTIETIGKTAQFLTAASNFLQAVDQAIDLAKMLAV